MKKLALGLMAGAIMVMITGCCNLCGKKQADAQPAKDAAKPAAAPAVPAPAK